MPKKAIDHVWEDRGADSYPYCQDCRGPTSECHHLERFGHHVYVCPECRQKRLEAPPYRSPVGGSG